MDTRLQQELEAIVGRDNVSVAKYDRITHSYDATQQQHLPDMVVYAESTAQVQAIVRLAARHRLPIIPRGAGSGFTGGTLPIAGGIVLVLTRMNRILKIDPDNMIAVVQPGVVTATLQAAVEQLGLFYPPDPASKDFSTLGGNVAECAGGPRCVKYGVTRDFVMGLEVVTATGEVIRTGGPTMKNVVGYDLTRLFVGSEGTLGVVTEITLKLLPKPAAKRTMLAYFASIDGAAQAVSAIIRNKIIPATLEFMDNATLTCLRDNADLSLPDGAQAALIIEVDGEEATLADQLERIDEIIKPLGVVTRQLAATTSESEAIWDIRRRVSPSLKRVNPHKFNEDIVVPRSRLPEMIRRLEAIGRKYALPIVNFGHAGDGNIHVNVMADLEQPGAQQRVDGALDEIFAATIELNGAISGEHGIGTTKQPFIAMNLDPATIAYMQAVKTAFDPLNIMNPGKVFPNTATHDQPER